MIKRDINLYDKYLKNLIYTKTQNSRNKID